VKTEIQLIENEEDSHFRGNDNLLTLAFETPPFYYDIENNPKYHPAFIIDLAYG
jgi:hypothetical protein